MTRDERLQEIKARLEKAALNQLSYSPMTNDLRYLLSLVEEQGWVRVTPETMPPNYHEVLVCATHDDCAPSVLRGAYSINGEWYVNQHDGPTCLDDQGFTITHWMEDRPLPLPPSAQEGK